MDKRSERRSHYLGLFLIGIGLLFNKWLIEATLVADGEIGALYLVIFIGVVQASLIGTGLYLAIRRPYVTIRRPQAAQLALLSFSFLITLVMVEIGIRLLPDYKYISPGTQLSYDSSIFSRSAFSQNETTVTGRNEAEYYINEKGYRGANFASEKPEGTLRIIFYGGSAVFDEAASLDQDWPHRVETQLIRSGFANVEAINAGIPGHASFDALGSLFSEGHTFSPDYVVLYNAWNDIKYFQSDESLLRKYEPYDRSKDPRRNYKNRVDRFFGERSYVYALLRDTYYSTVSVGGAEGAVPEGNFTTEIRESALEQYRLNVEMFVDLARNIGAEPILVTQARLVAPDNSPDQKARIKYEYVRFGHETLVKAFEMTDDILRSVAKAKDASLIDASKLLSGEDDAFVDHVHLTDEGSEKLATIISEHMANIINEK